MDIYIMCMVYIIVSLTILSDRTLDSDRYLCSNNNSDENRVCQLWRHIDSLDVAVYPFRSADYRSCDDYHLPCLATEEEEQVQGWLKGWWRHFGASQFTS